MGSKEREGEKLPLTLLTLKKVRLKRAN